MLVFRRPSLLTLRGRSIAPAVLMLLALLAAATPAAVELFDRLTFDTRASAGTRGTVDVDLVAPTLPGQLDIVLVLDQSGSYADDLPQLRGRLPELAQGSLASNSDLQFGIAGFNSDPAAYQVHLPLTNDPSEVRRVLERISTSGGETELWLHALDQVLDDFAFRPDSQVVVLLATDEPSGILDSVDPGVVAQRYSDRQVRVVGLIPANESLTQVTSITAQTGGSVEDVARDSSDVEQAILRGLDNLPVDIVPRLDQSCPLTQATFNPAEIRDVAPGAELQLRLDYQVDDTAETGNFTCTVQTGSAATTSFVLRVASP